MDTPLPLPPDSLAPAEATPPRPAPRLRQPDRSLLLPPLPLEQLLDPDHLVRSVWDYVLSLDLHLLTDAIKAVEHRPGRPAADPRLLVALWLFATAQGVTSARRLNDLCAPQQGSLPYLWLVGGVSVNYHTLADFRVDHADLLDQLLTDALAVLLFEGLIDLTETAQDSLRVRASAGSSSFRRRPTLESCYEQAGQHLQQLKQQAAADEPPRTPRQRAAQQRAAAERQQRLQQALQELQQLEQQRGQRGRDDEKDRGSVAGARASTTDPEARKMKMADGGYRPAYNVEFNTASGSGVIVGVGVSNHGNDSGCVVPMLEQTEERTGAVPERHLLDSGFGTIQDIEATKKDFPQTEIYAPVKNAKKKEAAGEDPYQPKPRDKEATAEWRQRMGTPEGKAIYKRRPQTAELSNAQARNRGLYQVRVRGLAKVKAVVLWYVLAHNMIRLWRLRAAKAEQQAAAAGQAEAAL
jgi:transposase/ribosomal protein L34